MKHQAPFRQFSLGRAAFPAAVGVALCVLFAGAAPAEEMNLPETSPRVICDFQVRPCQCLGPAAPYNILGVDCAQQAMCGCPCKGSGWECMRQVWWQRYAQGEYVGPARTRQVDEYRLRADDDLDMVYRLTYTEQPNPYRLEVGDQIQVESFTDPELDRELFIQPDGTITLRLLGQVHASGLTVTELKEQLDKLYVKYYKVPAITVTPLVVNSKLNALRAAVDRRYGLGGQSQIARVTPEGTINLPGLGTLNAQGLTLRELQREINAAYEKDFEGISVVPILNQRAPRYVYVLGAVAAPGRFEMTGPTTLSMAISMAGGWNVGANLWQIVVFRRGEDWRLKATMVNLTAALYGYKACPPGEIWLSDSDVVIVPKGKILVVDEFIDLVFTRGIYGVFPLDATLNFTKLSSL